MVYHSQHEAWPVPANSLDFFLCSILSNPQESKVVDPLPASSPTPGVEAGESNPLLKDCRTENNAQGVAGAVNGFNVEVTAMDCDDDEQYDTSGSDFLSASYLNLLCDNCQTIKAEVDQLISETHTSQPGLEQFNCNYDASSASFFSPQASIMQTSIHSYMSCDSALGGCESMDYYVAEDCMEDLIQNAVSCSIRPRFSDAEVPGLLDGGLDKLLPLEMITIIVTNENFTIDRYWTQENTVFGHDPNNLPQSIEALMTPDSFARVRSEKRTTSYDECILICGDKVKVREFTGTEQWMCFWMKERKVGIELQYTFVFVDACVPIAKIQIDETGRIAEYPTISEEVDITDYLFCESERLQGLDYREVIPATDVWHTSKHGVHYFISQEEPCFEIVATPIITGLVSVHHNKSIAWCSETLSRCIFGEAPDKVEHSDIEDRLPQFPSMIDNLVKRTCTPDDTEKKVEDNDIRLDLKKILHGATLMYKWICDNSTIFGSARSNGDKKPRLIALRNNEDVEVELHVKFSSQEDVPHWVFMKNVLPWSNTLADYKVMKTPIGEGSYGSVYNAYDRRSLRKVAIKYVEKPRAIRGENRGKKSLPTEIEVLKKFQQKPHPNCCEIYAHFDDPTYYYIVMGNYGKTLYSFIQDNPNLTERDSRHIFKQIAEGVKHLHETLNVVHRDLKDENVMIDTQHNARLIDFGSAAFVKAKGQKFSTFVGTVDYAAPEVLCGQNYTGKPQDIWALGVILYTIVHQVSPFNTPADIVDQKLDFPFPLNRDLQMLIIGMLCGIKIRYTIEDVVSHRWLDEE